MKTYWIDWPARIIAGAIGALLASGVVLGITYLILRMHIH